MAAAAAAELCAACMRRAGRSGRGGGGGGYLRRGTTSVDITTRLSCDTTVGGDGLGGDGVLAAWTAWAAWAAWAAGGSGPPSKAGHLHVSAKLVRWAEAVPSLRTPHRVRHVDEVPRHQPAGTGSVRVPTCAGVRVCAWVRGEGVGVG